jgi:hypothetical protein
MARIVNITSQTATASAPGLTAVAVSSSEIDLTALYSGSAALGTYTFQVSATGGAPWTTLATQAGNVYQHTGLASSTTYYYRCQVNSLYFGSSGFSAVAQATTPAAGGVVKWNPGHYMATGTNYAGDTIASIQTALNQLVGLTNIKGVRLLLTWGHLETAQGVYNYSLIDAVIAWLQANAGHSQVVVCILPGTFGGGLGNNDGSSIPVYIQQSPATYGAGPYITGQSGVWGQTTTGTVGTGNAKNGYAANLYNNNVLNRLIALAQALGARYDGNPNFEALMWQENSWWLGNLGLYGGAPNYSDANTNPAYESLLTACVNALPHTSVIMENTWQALSTSTQNLANWMFANRVAPGSADTVGHSAFANLNYAGPPGGLAWGLQAYFGIVASQSTAQVSDHRGVVRAMLDVEEFDISGNYYTSWGAPHGFTPLDIIAAANQDYKASHLFWQWMRPTDGVRPYTGQTVANSCPWASWTTIGGSGYLGVGPTINDLNNALTNIGYPGNYP